MCSWGRMDESKHTSKNNDVILKFYSFIFLILAFISALGALNLDYYSEYGSQLFKLIFSLISIITAICLRSVKTKYTYYLSFGLLGLISTNQALKLYDINNSFPLTLFLLLTSICLLYIFHKTFQQNLYNKLVSDPSSLHL